MGWPSRKSWKNADTSLQNAYDRAEKAGDNAAMRHLNKQIQDHADDRGVVNKAVCGIQETVACYYTAATGGDYDDFRRRTW